MYLCVLTRTTNYSRRLCLWCNKVHAAEIAAVHYTCRRGRANISGDGNIISEVDSTTGHANNHNLPNRANCYADDASDFINIINAPSNTYADAGHA